MTKPTQDGRMGKLATPLGKDVLLLSGFECSEGVGELFELRIDALSEERDIDFDQALGRNCSIHLATSDGSGRDFSGVLTEARFVGQRLHLYAYSLVLRPWLWLLSLTSDSRIFANMDPKHIIKQVFEDRGFSDVLDLAVQDYPTLEYTVQYREPDLSFVLRLMEEYGIYYYFQFDPAEGDSPSKHYLVLADSNAHVRLPKPAEVIYLPPTVGVRRDPQQFNDWRKSRTMVTGVFTRNDYCYEKPPANLLATAQFNYEFAHGSMELYDYPGDYKVQDQGKNLAQVSTDVERTRNLYCEASGSAASLTPGYAIKRNSPAGNDPDDGDYLILSCNHAFGYQAYESADAGAGGESYFGSYRLAESDIPYRMPQRTRRPLIVGTQSALVIKKDGGPEIDVDDLGRVLVQFYWDRKKKPSRRVRVAQFWAGSARGSLFVPRVGDEVLVAYEEGDPDRPIVVGSVYNGTNTVPMNLPPKKNKSGILTKSTPNSDGYNMLLFDDTAGVEKVKLRAQKDLMFKALNNEQRDIGGSQTENIGADETINVGYQIGWSSDGGNFTVNANNSVTLNVGIKGGAWATIKMDWNQIYLGMGSGISFIQITPEGIIIQAPTVLVQASAEAAVQAPELNLGADVNIAGALLVDGMAPTLVPA